MNVNVQLLELLCQKYGTRNLDELIDPCSYYGPRAPTYARTATRQFPMVFRGSPAAFERLITQDPPEPIRTTVRQVVQDKLRGLYPNSPGATDRDQGVLPSQYDIDNVYVNSAMLRLPMNGLAQPVGIITNVMPAVYNDTRKEQMEELFAQTNITPAHPNVVAHIPPSNDPDTHPIPLLNEIVNGYHGAEVCRTFGGIVARHLWKGTIMLTPAEAQSLGLPRPPAGHDAVPAPAGCEQQHNSWVIVPLDHVLGNVANLATSEIAQYTYEVYRLQMPNGNKIPILLMDTWTAVTYAMGATETILKVAQNRVAIADLFVEIVPLTSKSWLDSCVTGQEFRKGDVSMTLIVSYTLFPRGMQNDGSFVASLSPNFPQLSAQMKINMDKEFGITPAQRKALEVDIKKKEADAKKKEAVLGYTDESAAQPNTQRLRSATAGDGEEDQNGGGDGDEDGVYAMDEFD